ncbi:biopolymer transport protein ExbD [Balneicella halophila]|uniref:Biopolymer transport protein ExbD n=1 Tax=Balneicella halophila TaxID=1537566 RepID=A0A7L4UTP4_BALHA|nr:biopolymer transporter ExbD [Balneicella halophila]PVX52604.1 biopolymer transport protein ExbD [Balneicella halophila]
MARRKAPELNAGSMADIAFLLLIFFLVTTTMDTQTGIFRKLPPMEKVDNPPKIEKRNLLSVLVNKQDQIQMNGEEVRISEITQKAREFIENKTNSEDRPEKKMTQIEGYGEAEVSKGVVSLQNDRGTTYEVYIAVQDALATAFEQIREDKAREVYKKSYNQLVQDKEEEKVEVIKKMVPMSISEAEPKNIK